MKNLSIASGLALLASSFAFGQNQSTHFDFNDEESFMRQWTIIDANNDRQTWYWLDSAGVNNTGCVEVRTGNETEASNDYLITTSPIHLEQGESHMAFMLAARGAAWQEDLRLLYGKSTDTAEMEVIHEWTDFNNNTLEFHLIQFETKETGDYYFAFHAVSDGKPSNGFRFDELTIGSGTFQGIPDLSITNVELPISSCQLGSEESVSATVSNLGTAEISSFRLSYTVNGSNPVNETFDQSIPVGGSLTVTFAQKADFSASGTHQVEVQGEVIPAPGTQEENYLENNSGSDKTIHYLPTGTPFVTDFTQGLSENWDALNGTWVYNNKQQAIHAYADSILLSRCISLNEGIEYQFSILYKAGISLGYYERYGDFDIRYGLSGSPVAEWDTMASFREHYTYEKYVSFEKNIVPEVSGDYVFAIVPATSGRTLYIQNIAIDTLKEYDIRINDLNMFSKVPVEHMRNGTIMYASLENRGSAAIDSAIVTVKAGENIIGRSATSIAPQDTAILYIELQMPQAEIDEQLDLSIQAEIKGFSDATPEDNIQSRSMEITDDILAFDHVKSDMYTEEYAIGGSAGTGTAGIPLTISHADTLTGMSVGWVQGTASEIGLKVYKWDDATQQLGEEVFSITRTRSGFAGQENYITPAYILEPGTYMFAVSYEGLVLVIDKAEGGRFYHIIGDVAYRQTSAFGSPSIRAIFGHGKTPRTKDLAVEEITAPVEEGPFTANQTITALIQNNGSQAANGTVYLQIDKDVVASKALSMEPYALTEISFTADLSTPGKEYGLVVYTTMDGDEDPANDTCTKTVRCAPDADPYVMDFEGCLDFSIDGFNPRWKTLDLDKGYTWTVTDVSFPGMGEAMAFMAFNPSATNPSMIEYNMTAFQGEKFGACFGNASEEVMPPLTNNDWLISPKMKMAQDAKLSFFVRKYDPTLVEEYYVLVSADSDDPEDFHRVGGLREASAEWERVEVDLSEYANKEIYIAINCVSYDGYVFMIDDIRVSKPSANEGSALSAQLSLYPNPASEIISIQSTDARIQSVVLYDLSGRETFQSGNNLSTNLFRYNVSGLVPGIYFAKVQTTQGTEILKFVVR